MPDHPAGPRRTFRFPTPSARRARADVDAELAFHLDARARELAAAGLAPDEAAARARAEFGDVAAARRALAAAGARAALADRLRLALGEAGGDLRAALRALRRAPAFTLVAVATLALGIGANATMLALVDRLLLRDPAGVAAPDRVVRVYGRNWWTAPTRSWPDFVDLRDGAPTLAAVAAWRRAESVARLPARTPLQVARVTAGYLPLLGVSVQRGRAFAADEHRDGARVAVISDRLWRGALGGDPAVVGRAIGLGADRYRVIGVAAPGFRGVDPQPVDVFLPLGDLPPDRGNFGAVHVIARLAPGVSREAADRDANRANRAGLLADGQAAEEDVMQLGALSPLQGPGAPPELRVARGLAAVAALVLLAAVANVAHLLVARGLARRRETAVRRALGAGRWRLARQWLVEGLLLGALGGAAALALAAAAGPAAQRLVLPDGEPPAALDPRLALLTAALALLVGLACGLVPVAQGRRHDLAAVLRGGAAGRPRARARGALLLAQVACSVALLVGAGLFARSLWQVRALDPGFDAAHTVVVRVAGDGAALGDSAAAALLHALAREALAVPGVTAAAPAHTVPFVSAWRTRLYRPDRDAERWGREGGGRFNVLSTFVDPAFRDATGLALRRGRWLADGDDARAEPVLVVNEALAREVWPGEEALGRCLRVLAPDAPCATVVGVAGDTRVEALFDEPPAQYYVPLAQARRDELASALVVRTAGDADAAAAALRAALQRAAPTTVEVEARPLDTWLDPVRRPWTLGALVFALFAALGLLVAATGLYGVVTLLVAERTHELGVRRALGASGRRLAALVGRQLLAPVGAGIGAGLALGWAGSRAGAALLYGVGPLDPVAHAGAAALLLAAAGLACAGPLRRALRADPMRALREE